MKHQHRAGCAALAVIALAAAGCGKAANSGKQKSAAVGSSLALSPETPAAKATAKSVTWAMYRAVDSIDPIQAFDYPENTVISAMCDSLLRQRPNGSITSGLASVSNPNPTTVVLNINPAATFWDGAPVTAADAVYSLERNVNPKLASFYGGVFQRVAAIDATGPRQVTIHLKQPDYWLEGELSQMAGVVLQKSYVEREGTKFGTPQGGTMCSGAYKLKSWQSGGPLVAVANPTYWDRADRAKTQQITFEGVSDDASLTSGLETGQVSGTYEPPMQEIDELKAKHDLTVTEGPSFASDALVISSLHGVLGNVLVRRALSMAINRAAYISTTYHGMAIMPKTLANPGTWGYGRSVFQADWNRLPSPVFDVKKARQLVSQAGAKGRTLTIAMTPEIGSLYAAATAVRTAALAIGLKVKYDSLSAANYINLFTEASARKGVDCFETVNYPDYADPAGLYTTLVLPNGTQNYDGFNDPTITRLLLQSRTTANADKRAALVAKVGDLIMQQLPWIPLADPNTVLVTNRSLTGAPASFVFMGGPWANGLGKAG